MATASVVEMERSEQRKDLRLEIVRVIKAPKQRVFDAWTRPEMIRQWFGPGQKSIRYAETDLQVGGKYAIGMDGAKSACDVDTPESIDMGRDSSVSGRYLKVQPYDLLQFTWKGDWDLSEESMVTISLKAVEGGTEMTLLQEGFVTEISCQKHGLGWGSSLEKMVRLLESGLPASA